MREEILGIVMMVVFTLITAIITTVVFYSAPSAPLIAKIFTVILDVGVVVFDYSILRYFWKRYGKGKN